MTDPISRHLECRRCRGTGVCVAGGAHKDLLGNRWGWYRCQAGHDLMVPLTAETYDALNAALPKQPPEAQGNEGLA